jgi:hypothetical protein
MNFSRAKLVHGRFLAVALGSWDIFGGAELRR